MNSVFYHAGEINVTSIGKDLVEIQGVETGSYVCMNSQNGDMYVSVSAEVYHFILQPLYTVEARMCQGLYKEVVLFPLLKESLYILHVENTFHGLSIHK